MQADRTPHEKQYQLIKECRSSGLTDHQWCLAHGIKPGTFYNWIRRLRKRGYTDLPPACSRQTATVRQEIVKVEITPPAPIASFSNTSAVRTASLPGTDATPVMELCAGDLMLRIPNGTDPMLARLAISLLGGMPC